MSSIPAWVTDINSTLGDWTGAGGYGDPKKRPVEKVLRDVVEEKVSIDAAKQCYAVVIAGEKGYYTVDAQGTSVLRMTGKEAE